MSKPKRKQRASTARASKSRSSSTGAALRVTPTGTRDRRALPAATPTSRAQARAAYSGNRRRAMIVPWWQTRWAKIGGPVVGVLLVVVLFIILAMRGGGGINAERAPPDVLHGVSSISASTFATIGTGEVSNPLHSVTPSVAILRDASGKPVFLYVGGEFCPFCAAERWSMVVTLDRFGTFSNLHIISSSSTDEFANTPTFTFYKSTYTSPYLDFQPVELYDRNSATAIFDQRAGKDLCRLRSCPQLSLPGLRQPVLPHRCQLPERSLVRPGLALDCPAAE